MRRMMLRAFGLLGLALLAGPVARHALANVLPANPALQAVFQQIPASSADISTRVRLLALNDEA